MGERFIKPSGIGSRRDLFRSLAVVALGGGSALALGACSGPGDSPSVTPSSAGPVTVPKSSVPTGSGVIDGAYVITQPAAGQFKAFSSTCTHQGCPVSQITGSTIMCNCHGSEFSTKDGSVLRGPATRPLFKAKLSEDGDQLAVSFVQPS